jgi:hypothetical protein
MNKVFGIGWAKTGTTTLGKCFEILGYNHQTQRLDLVKDIPTGDLSRILSLAAEKDTFEDWPWIILYKKLDETFPGSKFILTKRDPEKWVKSYQNMLDTQGDADDHLNEVRRILYDLPFPNVTKEQLIARFEQHNAEVIAYFSQRPNDLLVVDWSSNNGWDNLCTFLGKDIPKQSFPHANQGNYSKFFSLQRLYNRVKKILS